MTDIEQLKADVEMLKAAAHNHKIQEFAMGSDTYRTIMGLPEMVFNPKPAAEEKAEELLKVGYKPKDDLYGPVVEELCKMRFSTPYGNGETHQCLNTLETHHAAQRILKEIAKDPRKYLPDELFGPSLRDTLDMVAKIKAAKKETEAVKEQLTAETRKRHEDHIEYKKEIEKANHEVVLQGMMASSAEEKATQLKTCLVNATKAVSDLCREREEDKKKIERLRAELDKREAEYNESELLWMTGLHEEVTAKLNAEDRANAAEVQAAGLQVEIDSLRCEEVELCESLNKVCDEFKIDVPDDYSDAFRKALKEASGDMSNELKVAVQCLKNARIDNDQLRTELRHAEERYTEAEARLANANKAIDELTKSQKKVDPTRIGSHAEEAILHAINNHTQNMHSDRQFAYVAVEHLNNVLFKLQATQDQARDKVNEQADTVRNLSIHIGVQNGEIADLKKQRDEQKRLADKMRPELASLRAAESFRTKHNELELPSALRPKPWDAYLCEMIDLEGGDYPFSEHNQDYSEGDPLFYSAREIKEMLTAAGIKFK